MILPRDGEHDWRGGMEAGPNYTPAEVPVAGEVFSITIAILVQILLAVCLSES
jgi:hypothetical protein